MMLLLLVFEPELFLVVQLLLELELTKMLESEKKELRLR